MSWFRRALKWANDTCKYCGWTDGCHPPGCPGEPKGK
jgi:hypothetical protein